MTVTISSPQPPPTQGLLFLGSGVWIGKAGYIATCQHVIGGQSGPFWIGLTHEPLTIGANPIIAVGNVASYQADLLYSDADTDVAILKSRITPERANREAVTTSTLVGDLANPPISVRVASITTRIPESGETLLLAGYPLDGESLILQTGTATGLFARPITDHVPVPSTKRLRIMLSLISNPGNSGGPVFDAGGKLIGILEGNLPSPIRDEQGHKLYYIRPKLGADGLPMHDDSGHTIPELAPYMQNAGISVAVPAMWIADLASKNKINLD